MTFFYTSNESSFLQTSHALCFKIPLEKKTYMLGLQTYLSNQNNEPLGCVSQHEGLCRHSANKRDVFHFPSFLLQQQPEKESLDFVLRR